MGCFIHHWKKDLSESCSVVSDSLRPHALYSLWNSPGQNTAAGSLSLLQGIFPTQGSNPDLPHCRWILYQLSHREAQEDLSNPISKLHSKEFLSVKDPEQHPRVVTPAQSGHLESRCSPVWSPKLF